MKSMSTSQRLILLVEDLDADYETLVRRLRNLNVEAPVHRCTGVDEAQLFLSRWKADDIPCPSPAILVLDLKLPDGDGQEVLVRVKSDEAFKDIPVVVWSSASDPVVQEQCLKRGASAFHEKAADSSLTNATIDSLVHLWRKVSLT